jgi:hypothetical protein
MDSASDNGGVELPAQKSVSLNLTFLALPRCYRSDGRTFRAGHQSLAIKKRLDGGAWQAMLVIAHQWIRFAATPAFPCCGCVIGSAGCLLIQARLRLLLGVQ